MLWSGILVTAFIVLGFMSTALSALLFKLRGWEEGDKVGYGLSLSVVMYSTGMIIKTITDGSIQEAINAGVIPTLLELIIAIIHGMNFVLGLMGFIQPLSKVVKSKFGTLIKPEQHLIMQLLIRKTAESNVTYGSLCFALAGEYFLYKTALIPEMSIQWTVILTAFLLLGSFTNQRILKYRVSHGLYGTCYSEAKEIVAFILEWQRKNGDSNHKPPKLVLKQEEIEQCLQVNGGEEYAG